MESGSYFGSEESPPVCTHYLMGICRYGDSCYKLHVDRESNNNEKEFEGKSYCEVTSRDTEKRNSTFIKSAVFTGKTNFSKRKEADPINLYKLQQEKRKTVCTHYKFGRCVYGDSCYKIHGQPDQKLRVGDSRAKHEPVNGHFVEETSQSPREAHDQEQVKKRKAKKKPKSIKTSNEIEPSGDAYQAVEPASGEEIPVVSDVAAGDDFVPEAIENSDGNFEERKLTKRERKEEERRIEKLAKKLNKKSHVENKAKEKLVEGFRQLKEMNLESSLASFLGVMALSKGNNLEKLPEASLGLAETYYKKGKHFAAREELKQAFNLVHANSKLHLLSLDEFYLKSCDLLLCFGEIDQVWEVLEKVESDKVAVSDMIRYYEDCLKRAEELLNIGYSEAFASAKKATETWQAALADIILAEDIAPECPKPHLLKAEILVHLHRFAEAEQILKEMSSEIELSSYHKCVSLLIEYYQLKWNDISAGSYCFIRLVQNFRELSNVESRWAHFSTKLHSIESVLSCRRHNSDDTNRLKALLNLDLNHKTLTSKLHLLLAQGLIATVVNRAELKNLGSKRASEILRSLETSLSLNRHHETLHERAKFYSNAGNFTKALEDLDEAIKLQPSFKYRHLRTRIMKNLDCQENLDHYEILDVDVSASHEEIKRAYRKKAKECHPDKHPTVSDSQKQELAVKMQKVNEAYNVLSEPSARCRYDVKRERKFDFYDSDSSSDSEGPMFESSHMFFSYFFYRMFSEFY